MEEHMRRESAGRGKLQASNTQVAGKHQNRQARGSHAWPLCEQMCRKDQSDWLLNPRADWLLNQTFPLGAKGFV